MLHGLRQANQRVIHREVAVRMVLTHHFSDDPGAFTRRAIGLQPHLLHGVENAAMHRLQSVANIRQRAANDDGHRVVEIRPPHFFFNIDRLNVQRARASAFAGWRSQRKFGILGIVRHENQLLAFSC